MELRKYAELAVDEQIKDLRGRSGFQNVWEELDKDIQQEIRTGWIDMVHHQMAELICDKTGW